MTIEDTKKIIRKSKNSWSCCNDTISMTILKRINKEISPHITHLCNCIIRTGIYPDKLKVSKILPILKPSKDMYDISGYRPINILG